MYFKHDNRQWLPLKLRRRRMATAWLITRGNRDRFISGSCAVCGAYSPASPERQVRSGCALRAFPTVKWAGKQSTHLPAPQPFHKYRAIKQYVPASYLRRAETMEPMRLAFRRELFIVLPYTYIATLKKNKKILCSTIHFEHSFNFRRKLSGFMFHETKWWYESYFEEENWSFIWYDKVQLFRFTVHTLWFC